MVVWITVITLALSVLAIQNIGRKHPKLAALTAVFMWSVYSVIWTLFVFRGVIG